MELHRVVKVICNVWRRCDKYQDIVDEIARFCGREKTFASGCSIELGETLHRKREALCKHQAQQSVCDDLFRRIGPIDGVDEYVGVDCEAANHGHREHRDR